MNKDSDNYQDDFEVYPSSKTGLDEFTQAFKNLGQALKPADAKLHCRIGEEHEDFIIRLALSSTNSQAVLFRKNDSAEESKVQAWLSIVSEKSKIFLIKNSLKKFTDLSLYDLDQIAKLSLSPSNIHLLAEILAKKYGIILVVMQGFKSMKMDGCTFKLIQGTPVVGISLRYNRYDNFWFTLMHELAHICLHYDQLDDPILDNFDEISTSDIEVEANIVAKNSLVSRNSWRLIWNFRNDKKQFLISCEKAEVHPAIAAGMIRHQSKNYTLYPKLQNIMDVRKAFGIEND